MVLSVPTHQAFSLSSDGSRQRRDTSATTRGIPTGTSYIDDPIIFPVHAIAACQGDRQLELVGHPLRARWDQTLSTVVVEARDSTLLPSTTAFAFIDPDFYGTP